MYINFDIFRLQFDLLALLAKTPQSPIFRQKKEEEEWKHRYRPPDGLSCVVALAFAFWRRRRRRRKQGPDCERVFFLPSA